MVKESRQPAVSGILRQIENWIAFERPIDRRWPRSAVRSPPKYYAKLHCRRRPFAGEVGSFGFWLQSVDATQDSPSHLEECCIHRLNPQAIPGSPLLAEYRNPIAAGKESIKACYPSHIGHRILFMN